MEIVKDPLDGLYIVNYSPCRFSADESLITYDKNEFLNAGITSVFVQDNQSRSVKGVLRGMHLQKKYPQAKLIRVVYGEIFDVAVDLRTDSKTFKKWYGISLSSENRRQLFIPKGFAHGFLVLSDYADVYFKVTDYYHPGDELGFAWNDPEINIQWPGVSGKYYGTASSESYTLFSKDKIVLAPKDSYLPILNEVLKML